MADRQVSSRAQQYRALPNHHEEGWTTSENEDHQDLTGPPKQKHVRYLDDPTAHRRSLTHDPLERHRENDTGSRRPEGTYSYSDRSHSYSYNDRPGGQLEAVPERIRPLRGRHAAPSAGYGINYDNNHINNNNGNINTCYNQRYSDVLPNPFTPMYQRTPQEIAYHEQHQLPPEPLGFYRQPPLGIPPLYQTPPYSSASPYNHPTRPYGTTHYQPDRRQEDTYPRHQNPPTNHIPADPRLSSPPVGNEEVQRLQLQVQELKFDLERKYEEDEENRRWEEDTARAEQVEEDRKAEKRRRKRRERRRMEKGRLKTEAEELKNTRVGDEVAKQIDEKVKAAMQHIGEKPEKQDVLQIQDGEGDEVANAIRTMMRVLEKRSQPERKLGFDERSTRSLKSSGTGFDSRRDIRVETASLEQRSKLPLAVQLQIQNVVYEVLQGMELGLRIQETSSIWGDSTAVSGKQAQDGGSPNYASRHVIEPEPRSRNENKQWDSRSPEVESQGQRAIRTGINQFHQNTVQLQDPLRPRERRGRRENDISPPVRNSAIQRYTPGMDEMSAEDEYHDQPTRNAQSTDYLVTKNGTRKRTEKQHQRRRHQIYEDSDESDEQEIVPRQSGMSSQKQAVKDRWHRADPMPPTVPDAPKAKGKSRSAPFQTTVATENDEDY